MCKPIIFLFQCYYLLKFLHINFICVISYILICHFVSQINFYFNITLFLSCQCTSEEFPSLTIVSFIGTYVSLCILFYVPIKITLHYILIYLNSWAIRERQIFNFFANTHILIIVYVKAIKITYKNLVAH